MVDLIDLCTVTAVSVPLYLQQQMQWIPPRPFHDLSK